MLCGTDPYPTDFKAKKYKLDKHSLSKVLSKGLGRFGDFKNGLLGGFCLYYEKLASACF